VSKKPSAETEVIYTGASEAVGCIQFSVETRSWVLLTIQPIPFIGV